MADDGFVTCLWFDGKAEEAAEFYTSVFPGSKIGRVGRYPEGSPGPAGSVMVVEFEANGQRFVALNGGPQFVFNEAVSLQVMCDDQAEVDQYWAKLSDGGEEGPCGWLKDRYGLSWQVIPKAAVDLWSDAEPEKAARAFEAMMTMKKLDLAALQAAFEGR
ncbi:3-demethylubiquinone-9 3-methyltransferase [Kitasatospora sp. MMS16-BH015]|uniref:VOC family protein n=1 Tax=Kitasatospora sp. MMS16-BH015 TaxID=2018025 RepID=UPI000CA16DC1|nr:VOC family protein [Kitasatospora sp. MMS16-BH015]AUG81306.1 3-demethylubiquinone-9 3-methyltransferase [Kitasatospora sp. MMS16-BH015]